MSTFSGLLVSITGALAHDIYGRILRPQSTPQERMQMFKVFAFVCGAAAILLGLVVENFEINMLVGWAFAIAATSYFPLLFLSTWWRGITMKGAASGMLAGGLLSLGSIVSTMFADNWGADGLKAWYAQHPLVRTLAEQPAIWGLPLALFLMVVVSKATRSSVPADVRRKMLVLHAPETLGLKEEYIKEHEGLGGH
jgi:Na+(H+)/acetate symporter ActP